MCWTICCSPEVAWLARITLCGVRARHTLRSKIDVAVLANIIIVDEPKILAALLIKSLLSNTHGAGCKQNRQNSNGFCHPAAHIWSHFLLVDLKVDMSDLHKVVEH